MVLFKKPNRKFRQREAKVDSDDEDGNDNSGVKEQGKSHERPSKAKSECTSSSVASSSHERSSSENYALIKTGRNLLSFHDEEDEQEVFKLNKPNHARSLAKLLKKERKKKQSVDSIESLNKKHEIKNESPTKMVYIDEGSSHLKEALDIISGKDAEDVDVDSGQESNDAQVNPFRNVLQSNVIPDAATIYAMKKHRQMVQKVGNFVSLEDEEETGENKSRLIREDDDDRSDDDDDDEEPSRISLSVNTDAMERKKVREAFHSIEEGNHEQLENEDAVEFERWEAEQIRKGVGIGHVAYQQAAKQKLFPCQSSYIKKSFCERITADFSEVQSNAYAMPLKKDATITTSLIKSRLQERLTSLHEVHQAHERELDSCCGDLFASTDLIEKLEKDGPSLSKRFSFYQQMRGYVRDLIECLDFKVADIEVLEQSMMNLFKARAENLINRRQQDIRDQSDEYSLLLSKVHSGSVIDLANDISTCIDEAKLRGIAEREGRRMRRRKKREQKTLLVKHHDGMSSDDEEPEMEVIKFKNKMENIVNEAEKIFDDVVEDFGTLEGLKLNFEKWKFEQRVSYCDAYVPLCLPKIFGSFVLKELICWNPLENSVNFENMHWYEILTFYGCLTSDVEEKDPDINLLPGIIEKIVLPKITGFVTNVWDPMSTKETVSLVSFVTKLIEDYPSINGKSKQMQIFLREVSSRIYMSLSDDVFIPLYPLELLDKKSQGPSTFFQRQFWSSVKLLHNILSWHGILAEEILQDMSLSSLLNRYLLLGLRTSITLKDTIDKCKVIVSSFPRLWFKNSNGITTVAQLKPFSQFLTQFALSHHHTCNAKQGLGEDEVVELIKEISLMLIAMGFLDETVRLRKQFSISSSKKL